MLKSKSSLLWLLLPWFLFSFLGIQSSPFQMGLGSNPLAVKDINEPEFQKAREKMIKRDLLGRDITDRKVLEVMGKVPRHLFVDPKYINSAYDDKPLPIDEGQTISQPYVVAFMTQTLRLKPGEKVLEIGTGSGYQAAVLAEITDNVFTMEIREKLTEKAIRTLKSLSYEKIRVKAGDGYFGWPEYAPFQAIIVTAAADHIPPPLIRQLDEGGRLVIPLGSTAYYQNLTLVEKRAGEIFTSYIGKVRFVPLTGHIQQSTNGHSDKERQ